MVVNFLHFISRNVVEDFSFSGGVKKFSLNFGGRD